jgi:hypothetical protein
MYLNENQLSHKMRVGLFFIDTKWFAYDSLVKHYDDRQAAHNRGGSVDNHTVAINQILSTEDLIDPNLHDDEKKKRVMQAVMASVIIHGARHSLSGGLPKHLINPVFENHFKILGLTEKITKAINQTTPTIDPKDFRLLNEYSGINKDTFLVWLDQVREQHQQQPVKSVIIPPPTTASPQRLILPSLSLDEIPQFSNPVVKNEYKGLNIPFTLAVTEQDVNDASSALPALNQRQQELGFNGWQLGYTDAGDFHRRAERWSDKEYNHYFEQGILPTDC